MSQYSLRTFTIKYKLHTGKRCKMNFAKNIETLKNAFPVIMSRKKAIKMREHEEAFKDLFMNITHEMKQPLTAALGFVGRVIHEKCGELLNDDAKMYLQKAHIGLSAMELNIMRSLTEIAMLDFKDDESLAKVITDIQAVIIKPILYAHSDKIQEKGIRVENKIEFSKITLRTNRSCLSAVFGNLFNNSVKYGPQDCEIILDSYINAEEKRRYFSVSDSGDPLDEEFVKNRLFEMFQRADPTSKEGTGVGLCINRKILRLLGGDITYNREKHEFLFWLPIE